jgi:hypothetical protein
VIEDALRAYLHRDVGTAGRLDLHGMLDRWSAQETGLDEDEAIKFATGEVHAYRAEQRDEQQ